MDNFGRWLPRNSKGIDLRKRGQRKKYVSFCKAPIWLCLYLDQIEGRVRAPVLHHRISLKGTGKNSRKEGKTPGRGGVEGGDRYLKTKSAREPPIKLRRSRTKNKVA